MRKLKLQMQVSLDLYISAKIQGMNWMIWPYTGPWIWDQELRDYFTAETASNDTILLAGIWPTAAISIIGPASPGKRTTHSPALPPTSWLPINMSSAGKNGSRDGIIPPLPPQTWPRK